MMTNELTWGLVQYSQEPGFWLPTMTPLAGPVSWHCEVACSQQRSNSERPRVQTGRLSTDPEALLVHWYSHWAPVALD